MAAAPHPRLMTDATTSKDSCETVIRARTTKGYSGEKASAFC